MFVRSIGRSVDCWLGLGFWILLCFARAPLRAALYTYICWMLCVLIYLFYLPFKTWTNKMDRLSWQCNNFQSDVTYKRFYCDLDTYTFCLLLFLLCCYLVSILLPCFALLCLVDVCEKFFFVDIIILNQHFKVITTLATPLQLVVHVCGTKHAMWIESKCRTAKLDVWFDIHKIL